MNTTSQTVVSPLPTYLQRGRLLPSVVHGGGGGRSTDQQRAEGTPIQLGDPGPCPAGGTTVFIVLDESASVAASDGNDPLSRRHVEAALAIRHLAAACHCRRDRVALLPFDRFSAGYVAPQPLSAKGVIRLRRGLRHLSRGCGTSSELGPALNDIEAKAGREPGAVAVVVLSDFLLTDRNPAAVLSRLRSIGDSVHAVVLGAYPPAALLDDPNVTVTRLTPSSAPGAAARAVFSGLISFRTHSTTDQGSAARHHQTDDEEGELIT